MRVRIGIEAVGAESLAGMYQAFDRQMKDITVKALNDTAKGIKTDTVKALGALLTVKQKFIRERIKVLKATAQQPEVEIHFIGERLPLTKFWTRPSKPVKRKPAGGVSVKIKRGEGAKVYRHSFVARMKSGHVGVYWREGRGRFPIVEPYGPAFTDFLGDSGDAKQGILRLARTRFLKNFDRAQAFYQRKGGGQ